ncbi:MAG: DUF2092 domain-containing protein [Chelatococcus sp.]|uniref:DUF2092 domain-containing protein n=1 Tax=unclassified Chelatococcus TaxID=2638111 RepID=UPI001BCB09B0|nr:MULTISPECIES: DUF2092 domain-containing protein [unclassified Chelatococcus]CAH1657695.1 conserved hypothetical protein [Hyphomicrobiales bacterium]MBS7740712.1 DUF2092 domain-containing protein [Chelatococcus sp. HY11]MBX3538767.1 DUF2092 domain-containing protein [Chelatococcus sp.]MBX3546054.1 DUF2092 domain-containing protein [Chelatococcus sp.]MCO5079803.1 DUF2092 domain-containing protein [Chelatococcus sp.]
MALELNRPGRVRLGAVLAIGVSLLLPPLTITAYAQNAQGTPPASTPPASPGPAAAPADGNKPILDQAVLDLLKKATARIADAKAFSVETSGSREVPSSQGQMLTFFDTAEVDVKRPNKLKAEIRGGNSEVDVYYDGKSVTIFDDKAKLYAVAEAPATLDAFLTDAAQKRGIHFPMADFLVSDPYSQLASGLTNAYEAGQTTVDGKAVRHLVFAKPGIEYQLWLDTKSNLPRLMTVTYLDVPKSPRFAVSFKDWEFRDRPDSRFRFSPGKSDAKIDFLPASQ